jgi:hypothetical protein
MGFVRLSMVLPVVMLGACGGKLPGFRVQEKSDSFLQASTTSSEIDMLFVIDNSGSMQDEQDDLADNFETFINEFASRDLDFQIGVISTDNQTAASWWNRTDPSSPYFNIYNSNTGSLLTKYSAYRWLSPSTPDMINKFKNNVRIGITGSGYEMPLTTIASAIDKGDASGDYNYGFFRNEAYLAVVIVTDEDEAVSTANDGTVSAAQLTTRLNTLETKLNGIKGSSSKYGVYSIAAPSLATCPSAVKAGTSVFAAAARFNGETGNICTSFASTLTAIGSRILSMATRFRLVQPPDGDLEVYVNGALYPRDTTHTNGWDYLAATQEVEFYGSYIPSAGSTISVNYIPAAPTN